MSDRVVRVTSLGFPYELCEGAFGLRMPVCHKHTVPYGDREAVLSFSKEI